MRLWISYLYSPGQLRNTLDLLQGLNTHVYRSFRYVRREEPGVQSPAETIALGTGSCRDYAVLLMEAARHWGFGARFVTGYVQIDDDQHGATHAWTEIYIPGAGWLGFDPTNNMFAGAPQWHSNAGHHASGRPCMLCIASGKNVHCRASVRHPENAI